MFNNGEFKCVASCDIELKKYYNVTNKAFVCAASCPFMAPFETTGDEFCYNNAEKRCRVLSSAGTCVEECKANFVARRRYGFVCEVTQCDGATKPKSNPVIGAPVCTDLVEEWPN